MEGLSGMKVTWQSARRSITWNWLSSHFIPLAVILWTHLNTIPAVPDLDRNNLIQATHPYHNWHSRPQVLICFTSITYPLSVTSPGLSWCYFYTLVAENVVLNYHSVKRKEFAFYFFCLESCLNQTSSNHVQNHKNEVSKLWIKICNRSLKLATVLQPCKVTSVPVFQKGPQGFLES